MKSAKNKLKRAILWESSGKDQKVQCTLCHHRCVIEDGDLGRCGVRQNLDGVLYSLNYDKICAASSDPIEKKPLFHFQPGSQSFSVAAMGCNFRCKFCQNWQISQVATESGRIDGQGIAPEHLIEAAIRKRCKNMAYTYTEPTIFMELCHDCGQLAKDRGLANVFVSNGYMTRKAVDFVSDWLDGINIDLKAFNGDFYKTLCKARLQPVLDTISYIAKETNIWIEITTLLVTGRNDSEEELKKLADFIVEKAGPDVPWHISRFYPQYIYQESDPTPLDNLDRAYEIGVSAGLRYIYFGNVPGSETENTFCYQCGRMLIERTGYRIIGNHVKDSKCTDCGAEIAGFEL